MDIIGPIKFIEELEQKHEDHVLDAIERVDDDQKQFEFHLEEYRAAKAEILHFEEELIKSERFSLIGVVAVYAFILGGNFVGGQLILIIIWWIPPLFIYYVIRKLEDIRVAMWIQATYLIRLQRKYADTIIGGWEVFCRSNNFNKKT